MRASHRRREATLLRLDLGCGRTELTADPEVSNLVFNLDGGIGQWLDSAFRLINQTLLARFLAKIRRNHRPLVRLLGREGIAMRFARASTY